VNISSVIVTYEPNIKGISDLIKSNYTDFNTIVIVDNCSSNIDLLKESIVDIENIIIIELNENLGIAYAQNVGICSLNDTSNDLIVFFDQDSYIGIGFIEKLIDEYKYLESINDGPFVLGPSFYHRKKHFEYPIIKLNRYGFREKIYLSSYKRAVEVSCIISSGMCVRRNVLADVGQMDSSLFIDYVDTEWCLRAISKGVRIFASPVLIMEHEIGDDNIKLFRWRIPVHSAFRRYYRIRNSFILFKYPHVPLIVCLRELIFSVTHQFLLIILTKNKKDYIKSLYRAVRDGLISLFKKR
jgi:rhamnosyltransferase